MSYTDPLDDLLESLGLTQETINENLSSIQRQLKQDLDEIVLVDGEHREVVRLTSRTALEILAAMKATAELTPAQQTERQLLRWERDAGGTIELTRCRLKTESDALLEAWANDRY